MTVLRKIDCVLVPVSDLAAAATFYHEVFGLTRLWEDATSIGMGMPETDAELVLHTRDITAERSVTCLVGDVDQAVKSAVDGGCEILTAPFDVPVGKCAVLQDPFGNPVCILDLSKGPRSSTGKA